MKKGFNKYLLIWIILVVIFNLICFVTPSEIGGFSKFEGSFFFGYLLIMLAFIGQLLCMVYALKDSNKDRLFLNLPIITISYRCLIFSIIIGIVIMIIPGLPKWVGAIICILILGFNAVAIIKASAAADIVEEVGDRIKAKTLFIKLLTNDAESLLNRTTDIETKKHVKKVYDAIRYSDPMSDDALASCESQITIKFNEFQNAINNNKDIEKVANELIILVNDRNNKCKLLK